jgi:hypothetical protein
MGQRFAHTTNMAQNPFVVPPSGVKVQLSATVLVARRRPKEPLTLSLDQVGGHANQSAKVKKCHLRSVVVFCFFFVEGGVGCILFGRSTGGNRCSQNSKSCGETASQRV